MNPSDPESPADPNERLKHAGERAASSAKAKARSGFDQSKRAAADSADRASEALSEASEKLSEAKEQTLADGAKFLSERLSSLADDLKNRSVDELTSDARRLARDNPGMFVAGGVALGLALTRFFKASASTSGPRGGNGDTHHG